MRKNQQNPLLILFFLLTGGVALLWLALPPALADSLFLKETTEEPARQLKGTIIRVSDREVIFETTEGVRLPISRDGVDRIIFSNQSRDTVLDGSPVPEHPQSRQTRPANSQNLHQKLALQQFLQFPDPQGRVDDRRFITLSRFVGSRTGQTYAGLYNFPDKGTFWIHLPRGLETPGLIRFTLYGKKNEGHPTERFSVMGRFIDARGQQIGESPIAFFRDTSNRPIEWFRHLEEISGLGGTEFVEWHVPAHTRSIELRARVENNPERHLVGYLSNLSLLSGAKALVEHQPRR